MKIYIKKITLLLSCLALALSTVCIPEQKIQAAGKSAAIQQADSSGSQGDSEAYTNADTDNDVVSVGEASDDTFTDLSVIENSPLRKLYKEATSSVTIDEYQKDILQSDIHTLTLKNVTDDMKVTFKSSDTDVLKVKKISDSKCRYTGVGYGTAKIIVTVEINTFLFFWTESETFKLKISVTPHAASVKWTKSEKTIIVGKKATIGLTIRPSISEEVPIFRSKNTEIATISAKGKITAKKVGVTYVTATIENGKSDQCKIIVKNAD